MKNTNKGGNLEIREVYKFDKATVAGCYVLDGRLKRDAKIRLFRDGILIYPKTDGGFAELGSLKCFKDNVKEVDSNWQPFFRRLRQLVLY